jgi:kynureninase
VTLSHVAYRSAFLCDMAEIDGIAHDAGALSLWDLSHSAGSVPVALDADAADLAVGCTYKYLSGGPGAPAFLYVRAAHQAALQQPIWGWIGRRDAFAMEQAYEAAAGIGSSISGTPDVLGLSAVAEGVELVAEAGIERIRAKGIALTELAIELSDAWLAPLGVIVGSPRDARRRGAHVALVHPDARRLSETLIAQGTIVDFRMPDVVRIGLSPLTTRFVDVWDGLVTLRGLLERDG